MAGADNPNNIERVRFYIYFKEFLVIIQVELNNLNEYIVFEVDIQKRKDV